jgi:hypothetical protein
VQLAIKGAFISGMKSPRWFNPTFYAGIGLGLVWILYTAYRRGYDANETFGFAALSIFMIFVVLGIVLTALTAVVNLINGKGHLPKLSPPEKQIATACSVSISVQFVAIEIASSHPLGWLWSEAIGVAVYTIAVFLAVKLSKGLPHLEMTRS